MASTASKKNPVRRVIEVLRFEKAEISAIYFYAILAGLVQLSLPLGVQAIISFVLGGSISTSLVLLITGVIAGVFINGLLQVNGMKLIERIQQQLFVRYSFFYAHSLPRLDLRAVDGYYLPELVNRFFDTVSLQKGLAKLLLDIPLATIQIFFGLMLLSFYHPVFIFFGILLLLVLWAILRFTANRGIETSLLESDYKYRVADYLEDLARRVVTYKFARRPDLHLGRTDRLVAGYLGARTSHFRILVVQYWSLIAFKVLITATMLIVGALLLIDQQLNVGQFIAAEIVILTVIGSVEKLIVNLDNVYDVLTAVEKLSKVTDKPQDGDGTQDPPVGTAFGMRAVDLGLAFPASPKPALQGLTFSIQPGEKVCITGPAGSGKSTLLRVLAGVYTPTQGSLLLADIPLSQYNREKMRVRTGLMLQDQGLVRGTLLENITMGEDLNPAELARMEALATRLGLMEFIQKQPDGYTTELEPEGTHLSTRVVRQIALTRALLHNPALILLEEPWTDMRPESEAAVKEYLLRETGGATVVVTTCDTAFAMKCDRVIILDDGGLKAVGNPQELADILNPRDERN